MNDLAVVEKPAEWDRLKQMVLDSVSSPITRRVYNMALEEFLAWFRQAPRPGFTKATVSAWRVSLKSGASGRRPSLLECRLSESWRPRRRTTGCSRRNWPRDRPREEREVRGHPNWELALCAAGPNVAQRAGRLDAARAARPRHPRRSPWLRTAAVRGGGTHVRAHPAAR